MLTQIEQKSVSYRPAGTCLLAMMITALLQSGMAYAAEGGGSAPRFTDITSSAGIDYRRTESPRDAILDVFKQPGAVITMNDVPLTPGQSRGNPGVAIFDYDRDGDLDIYATNGPGTDNSLYVNQLSETGALSFIDAGASAGVGATAQDSNGVCYGDIDNDGDQDLYVLGASEPNRLFENLGNGSFRDITVASQTGGGERNSITCSFGDVNGDGLLDLAVANLYDNFDNRLALTVPGFEHLKEHNFLFVNQGGNTFADRSAEAGIESFRGGSWALVMVDYDQDGDIDIVVADDQGTRLPEEVGGENFGYVRVLRNDGSGNFDDVTEIVGTDIVGDWMGLTFGDLNSDGNLDLFITNIGDYLATAFAPATGLPNATNQWSSRWFLGQDNGTFIDPGIGELGATPFGWSVSMIDYDNDNDLDIVYHGGADMGLLVDGTNPGALLVNDGDGHFVRDADAFSLSRDHQRRNVQGMATGDLNRDGFVDIVSVSSMDWPTDYPVAPIVNPAAMLGGQFDDAAGMWPTFLPMDPANPFAGFDWSGWEPADGTMSVEINSGNRNESVQVTLLGTVGLTDDAVVNRDAIGAVVTFTPSRRNPVTKPVISGGSHASADSLELTFGMGNRRHGTLDILWPGGVRNRLYHVREGERIVFPEIPCSYSDAGTVSYLSYVACVRNSLRDLTDQSVVSRSQSVRYFVSAIRAFHDARRDGGN
ncbi:MAG: hypothetical protein Tsb002_26870 [Wenzhouxiangellaceae bacterium]